MRKVIMLAAVTLATAGCGDVLGFAVGAGDVHVESNTSWSGHISYGDGTGESLQGSGARKISAGVGTVCWTFQKRTEHGSLVVYGKRQGVTEGRASTSAAYGVVSGCMKP
jgi:hypothetical protein